MQEVVRGASYMRAVSHTLATSDTGTSHAVQQCVRGKLLSCAVFCGPVSRGAVFVLHCCCCREALLNAFSDVDEAGNFTSSITKPRDRFLKVKFRPSPVNHWMRTGDLRPYA
jgi:hypothetical protein